MLPSGSTTATPPFSTTPSPALAETAVPWLDFENFGVWEWIRLGLMLFGACLVFSCIDGCRRKITGRIFQFDAFEFFWAAFSTCCCWLCSKKPSAAPTEPSVPSPASSSAPSSVRASEEMLSLLKPEPSGTLPDSAPVNQFSQFCQKIYKHQIETLP